MSVLDNFDAVHQYLTRRFFLRLGAAGAAAIPLLPWGAAAEETAQASGSIKPSENPAVAELIQKLTYLTPAEDFNTVERGDPIPYTHPPEKLKEVGLTRETWKLEVVPDPKAPARMKSPLAKEKGTAVDWEGLMKLAETKAVRFLKIMSCNNINTPLGIGLWEGVPLRDVIWLARPTADLRRVFYHGYHNDKPEQLFQSSLPIGRVLEDPPGEHPVILCYKLNGELLSGRRGGPVRMLVPDAYGFKSVKWLQRVVLSNMPAANDTYADGNNDIDSWLKTFAQLVSFPEKAKAGQPLPITGAAQVGISGLSKVQYWICPADAELPEDDPYFTKGDWKDAEILGPPTDWGGGLKDGKLPEDVRGFDATGKPKEWPMRYTRAHWAALIPPLAAGKYNLRCRSIDANGIAQPLPRPFKKSGWNGIQTEEVEIV